MLRKMIEETTEAIRESTEDGICTTRVVNAQIVSNRGDGIHIYRDPTTSSLVRGEWEEDHLKVVLSYEGAKLFRLDMKTQEWVEKRSLENKGSDPQNPLIDLAEVCDFLFDL